MTDSHAFERIHYFGDSLTDSGAFFEPASQLLAFPQPSPTFAMTGSSRTATSMPITCANCWTRRW